MYFTNNIEQQGTYPYVWMGQYFDPSIALINQGAKPDPKIIEMALAKIYSEHDKTKTRIEEGRSEAKMTSEERDSANTVANLTALVVASINKGIDPEATFEIADSSVWFSQAKLHRSLAQLPPGEYPEAIIKAAQAKVALRVSEPEALRV